MKSTETGEPNGKLLHSESIPYKVPAPNRLVPADAPGAQADATKHSCCNSHVLKQQGLHLCQHQRGCHQSQLLHYIRVSCYHHCTINLFGDQIGRDNHPTIDSVTDGGNPMITSSHHKNVSKHSLSKSRSDIGHRVIHISSNTMQCTSYLTNSILN